MPRPNAGLWLIEAKAGKTVHPGMAAPLLSLQRALGTKSSRLIVVHRKTLRFAASIGFECLVTRCAG